MLNIELIYNSFTIPCMICESIVKINHDTIIERQDIIKALNNFKHNIDKNWATFTKATLTRKFHLLFNGILISSGKYNSKYAYLKNQNSGIYTMLRISDHSKSDHNGKYKHSGLENIETIYDFIFFDKENPNNQIKSIDYKDCDILKTEYTATTNTKKNSTHKIYHYRYNIDSIHFNSQKDTIKIIDSIINLIKTGKFQISF